MSVWTRYKFEKTRLPPSFQLINKPQQNKPVSTDIKMKSKTNASVQRSQITQQMRDHMASDSRNNNNEEEEEETEENEVKNEESQSQSDTQKNSQSQSQAKKAKKKTAENQSKLPSSFIRHSKKEIFCPQCRNGGAPLEDPKAGRIVCTQCGLVLEVGYISEQSEWRNFADSDKSGPDPNRVGSAGHYLLIDAGDLSTKIDDGYLRNLQQSTTNSNVSTQLFNAIRKFESVGRGLGLTKDTQNCSGEIFKDLSESDELRKKSSKTKQAISMYLACKMCAQQRPFTDICGQFGVDQKTVRKLFSEIQRLEAAKKLNLAKHRQKVMNSQRSHNRDAKQSTVVVYAVRYASKLQCSKRMNKHLRKIVEGAEKFLASSKNNRQPTSLAAACVYLACAVQSDAKDRRSYKEISAATNVSVSTIQNVYRSDLFPKRMQLVPEDYVDRIKVQNLSMG